MDHLAEYISIFNLSCLPGIDLTNLETETILAYVLVTNSKRDLIKTVIIFVYTER